MDTATATSQLVQPRNWIRLYSTRESVKNGEISVLAIIETLAAMALVFLLASYVGTLNWLAAAIPVAPLLLLRTQESTHLAIRYWDAVGGAFDKPLESIHWDRRKTAFGKIAQFFPWLLLMIVVVLVGMAAARFGATLVTLIRHPIKSVRAIPENWARLALSIDFCSPVEPLPDHDRFKDGMSGYVRGFFDESLESGFTADRMASLLAFLLAIPVMVALYFPAVLYRLSLKATSLVYVPLVFLMRQIFSLSGRVRDDLRIRKSDIMANLGVVWGLIVIVAFFMKLFFLQQAQAVISMWNSREVRELLVHYLAPAEIPKWQLFYLLNCFLSIGIFLFVRKALVRIENNRAWPEKGVQRTLGLANGLSWLITFYTISCTGYITIRAAQGWDLPAIGERWFPWQ